MSVFEKSLIMNRPKRIHRLPSRFMDHSISTNKFIPVQPSHASTPIKKKRSQSTKKIQTKQRTTINIDINKNDSSNSNKNSSNKTSPDSNNNPKRVRSARLKVKSKMSPDITSPKNVKNSKRIIDKSLSFKILDDSKNSRNSGDKLDVYEFTFDPDEEPQPQKKKKKKVVKKKPSKPRTIVFKNNYDKNMSKAMASLKDAVTKHAMQNERSNKKAQNQQIDLNQAKDTKKNRQMEGQSAHGHNTTTNVGQTKFPVQYIHPISDTEPPHHKVFEPSTKEIPQTNKIKSNVVTNNICYKSVYENPPSIRVEDIEADSEISYHHDDINYSPVNSPRPLTPNPVSVTQNSNVEYRRETIERAIHNKDPLNLQDDISFFDDQPVASSSMNISIRHPLASPWRVEFGSLPIKWPANTYLKPNMTPAVESSFISSEESHKKKHVYVSMIPQTNESLPQIVENSAPYLKQTSIISFIKEVAERNAKKKKRGKCISPIKASTLFEDITNKINADAIQKTSKKVTNKAIIENTQNNNYSNSSSNTSNDKENVRETRKRKNENSITKLPGKSPRKEKDKNVSYFGFDDSENQDQENMAPNKNAIKNRAKSLRSRSRVLQEVNGQNGPARAALPLTAKVKITSSSKAVKRMYEELKSAVDAPQFLDENDQENSGTTNDDLPQNEATDNDQGESVHLFEDVDVVHYLKPTRKSYGKAKKVTFRQCSNSDSETQVGVRNPLQSSDEDDLADLTFTMPEVNQKKTVKKKKTKKVMSKKEEKEADEWAAGFNSMCEDIEEFPLLVE